MPQAYQSPPPPEEFPAQPPVNAQHTEPSVPGVAIRRHTDRCFFAVEETVEEADGSVRGYIVGGVLIDKDDVAEVRGGPACCE